MDTTKFRELVEGVLANHALYQSRAGAMGVNDLGRILDIISDNKSALSTSDIGKIAYNRSGSTRARLSVRRYLTRILHLNDYLSDVNLGKVADRILDAIQPSDSSEIEFLKGADIVEAYRSRIGGGSCMTGDDSYKTGLYAANPKRISLAVIRIDNSSARCIVWLADDNKRYHDRIYADSARPAKLLEQGLSGLNIPCIYDNSDYEISVSNLEYEDGKIPYLDSLCYGTLNGSMLSINNVDGPEDLQSTDGYLFDGVQCCNCGEHMSDDCSYSDDNGDTWCESCYSENHNYCERCEGSYNINHTDFIEIQLSGQRYSQYLCKDCILVVATKCDMCGEWTENDKINETSDNEAVCWDCIEKHYGTCEECDKLYLFEEISADGYCPDCEKTINETTVTV